MGQGTGTLRRTAGASRPHRNRALVAAAVASLVVAGLVAVSPFAGTGESGPHHPGRGHGVHLLAGAALASRALYGWGGNDAGQVGNGVVGGGSTTGVTTPVAVDVPAGTTMTSVATGGAFSVGLTTDGTVEAWGDGLLGELGDGTTTSSTVPVDVDLPAGTTVTQVTAGSSHALALTSTGQVYAWGAGADGQIGDGTTTDRTTPTPVSFPPGTVVTQVPPAATTAWP